MKIHWDLALFFGFSKPSTSVLAPARDNENSPPTSAPTTAPESVAKSLEFSEEELAIAARIREMVNDFASLYHTDLAGKARNEVYKIAMECLDRLGRITESLKEHSFVSWKERDKYEEKLRLVEIEYQPLHQRQHKDSTLVAVVDTETTGLTADDEPVSVAVVLLDVSGAKGEMIEEVGAFYGLREPAVPINPQALRIHGLGMDKLRGQVLDYKSLRRLVDSADLLVAHNAKFDRRMLAKLIPKVATAEWGCSIYSLKYDWAKIADGQSLDAICRALEIERPQPHNALADCRALISVLKTRAGIEKRSSTRMARMIQNAWAPPL